MKRLFAVLLLLMFVFVGCVGSSSVVGKYYHEGDDDGSYIELKKDGSVWVNVFDGEEFEEFEFGTYTAKGNDITIQLGGFFAGEDFLKGTVKGKTMTLYPEYDEDDIEVFIRR